MRLKERTTPKDKMAETTRTYRRPLGLLALLTVCLACNAPRHNPLDPKNPDYAYVLLSGSVQTMSVPHQALDQVQVLWSPERRLTFSDRDGHFSFDALTPQDGYLYFSSENYRCDSVKISWQQTKEHDVQVYLNHHPSLDKVILYSTVLNRYPNLRTYTLTMQAWISDPDMDIDSVWIDAAQPALRGALPYNPTDKSFSRTFSSFELAPATVLSVVGQEVRVQVTDVYGHQTSVGATALKRVVTDEILYVQPSSYALVTAKPRLQWKKLQTGFPFTCSLEIYTDEIVAGKVWEKTNLAADVVEYQVDKEIPVGDYFWVIWCVDEFGNRSRSKPASFTVQ